MTRRALVYFAVALVTLGIELGAMLGTVSGAPFSPVSGWGATRPTDALAFALVGLGCLPLAFFPRFPLAVAIIATASYPVFAWRDYELGMFLPPMVVIFALVGRTQNRLAAILCAAASLGVALVWVAHRADPIDDSGVTMLVWFAFGTVLGVFFVAPILVGEVVRIRSLPGGATAPLESSVRKP